MVWLCRALRVSRASFYRWRTPVEPSPRAVRHEELVTAVVAGDAEQAQQIARSHFALTYLTMERSLQRVAAR